MVSFSIIKKENDRMYLIDTHTHIYTEAFDSDRLEAIRRAEEAGVITFLLPNIDEDSVARLHALCDQYPHVCFPMMGLHPTSVNADYRKKMAMIRKELDNRDYIAIGEIGVDLYWDKTYLKEQIEVFEEQLRWSIDKDLPVVIHTREAFPQVFESLHKIGVDKLRGVLHSFSGSREELEAALRCPHFLLGVNGIVTYKNAVFRDYLPLAPLERIVLETDAPYLAPVPFRGKRNEPAYLKAIAQQLATIYQLPVETIAAKTSENARRLFSKIHPMSVKKETIRK